MEPGCYVRYVRTWSIYGVLGSFGKARTAPRTEMWVRLMGDRSTYVPCALEGGGRRRHRWGQLREKRRAAGRFPAALPDPFAGREGGAWGAPLPSGQCADAAGPPPEPGDEQADTDVRQGPEQQFGLRSVRQGLFDFITSMRKKG